MRVAITLSVVVLLLGIMIAVNKHQQSVKDGPMCELLYTLQKMKKDKVLEKKIKPGAQLDDLQKDLDETLQSFIDLTKDDIIQCSKTE